MERISRCTWSDHIHYDPSHYRVVFASSAPIGKPFLDALHRADNVDVVGVMSMPDAPVGRWQKLTPNIIKQQALDLWLSESDIITPSTLSQKKEAWQAVRQRLLSRKIDYLVVIAYGKIIPQAILDIPRIAPLNIHGSLLPEYRWASPLQSVFLDRKKETGITMMRMEAWLDTWPIIDTKKKSLWLNETVVDLIDWIQEHGPRFLLETMKNYAREFVVDKPQDDALASHCSKFVKEDGAIDPLSQSLDDIFAKHKAFALWPKVFFAYKDKTHTITSLTVDENLYDQYCQSPLFVASDDGSTLSLNAAVSDISIKPQWKKALNRESRYNGYR